MPELKAVFVDGWPVIAGAPVPVLLLMLAAGAVGWWLARTRYAAQLEARAERLTFAAEQLLHMREDKDRLKEELATLKNQIAVGASYASLNTTSTSARRLVGKLEEWGDRLEGTLTGTFKPHMVFQPVGKLLKNDD